MNRRIVDIDIRTNKKKGKLISFFAIILLSVVFLAFLTRTVLYNIYRFDYFAVLSSYLKQECNIDIDIDAIPIFFDNKKEVEVDFGYFSNQLSKSSKYVYQQIYNACLNEKTKLCFTNKDVVKTDIQDALNVLACEHPIFYNLKTSITYSTNTYGYFVIKIDEYDNDIETVKQLAESLKKNDDYQTVLTIHDYIVDTTQYFLKCDYNQDYRSCLLTNKAVCAGYADAFTVLCQLNGIECYTVAGQSNDSQTQNHAWCLVKINDQFYWVDPTWDDNIDRYDYFLCDDENFLLNHMPDELFECPKCYDDSLYMKEYKNVCDSFEVKRIRNIIKDSLSSYNEVTIHFKRNEDVNACFQYLFKNYQHGINDILVELSNERNDYAYSKRNKSIYIKIN